MFGQNVPLQIFTIGILHLSIRSLWDGIWFPERPYGFYSDAQRYLNSLTTPSSGINTINYNGHIWKYKQISNSSNYKNIYAYKHNDTLYLITLSNTNYYSCNTSYDQILPTLKFYN